MEAISESQCDSAMCTLSVIHCVECRAFRPRLVRIWKPYEKQQEIRERKARIAAQITNVVKGELLERLHEGVYEGIYNFPQRLFNEAIDETAVREKMQAEMHEEDEVEREQERIRNRVRLNADAENTNDFLEDGEEERDIDALSRPLEMVEPETKDIEKEEEGDRGNFVGLFEDDSDYETEDDIEEAPSQIQREIEYEYEFGNEMVMNMASNRNGSAGGGGSGRNRSILKGKRSAAGKRKSVRWLDQEESGDGRVRKKRKVSIGYD